MPKDDKPQTEAKEDLRTPEQWAAELGHVGAQPKRGKTALRIPSGRSTPRSFGDWQHEAAAQLHGWRAHKDATVEPFLLSRAAYEAALKAASGPGKSGRYEPHRPACSPYLPEAS